MSQSCVCSLPSTSDSKPSSSLSSTLDHIIATNTNVHDLYDSDQMLTEIHTAELELKQIQQQQHEHLLQLEQRILLLELDQENCEIGDVLHQLLSYIRDHLFWKVGIKCITKKLFYGDPQNVILRVEEGIDEFSDEEEKQAYEEAIAVAKYFDIDMGILIVLKQSCQSEYYHEAYKLVERQDFKNDAKMANVFSKHT